MSFNIEKFKKTLEEPGNYFPLVELRKLGLNSKKLAHAYDMAVQFLADTEELQSLYFSLDYSGKNSMVELLAAGMAERELRQEMEERPWAYEKEIAERARLKQEAQAKAKPAPKYVIHKKSRFGEKKPLSQWEIEQAQKRG